MKRKYSSVEFLKIISIDSISVYQIKLGTIDQLDACDTEWQYRPFMNTAKKRQFLANDNDKE